MKDITPFQIGMLALFVVFTFGGIFFFSSFRAKEIPDEEAIGGVVIWGTYDGRAINGWLNQLQEENENLRGVSYKEFSKKDFNNEVLVAMAESRSPDLLLLDNTELYEQTNRIEFLSPEAIGRASFRTSYLEVAEIYFSGNAVMGLPLLVDPMVMFWNRSMFSNEGLVAPPKTWQEFFDLTKLFTIVNAETLTISQTAIPLGESVNVKHNKEILASLLLQSGNPVVLNTDRGYQGTLAGSETYPSAVPSLNFYTEFSNPSSEFYSWNRSMPNSEDFFLAGKSAVFFGFASEVKALQLKNPNLNFDIADMPQTDSVTNKAVYARVYGLFVSRNAKNREGAMRAMAYLASTDSNKKLIAITKLASPRRDVSGTRIVDGDDAFMEIFRKQAVFSRSFIDPSPAQTDKVFGDMIDRVTSGIKSDTDAASLADQELSALFSK